MNNVRYEYCESGNKKWWKIFAPIGWLILLATPRKLPIKIDEKERAHVDWPATKVK